jgi:hypothetical protein
MTGQLHRIRMVLQARPPSQRSHEYLVKSYIIKPKDTILQAKRLHSHQANYNPEQYKIRHVAEDMALHPLGRGEFG